MLSDWRRITGPALIGVGLVLGCGAGQATGQGESGPPHLRVQGNSRQLIVQGRPFLILGGELHNSSASSLAYMEPIWPKLKALGLNTVLATATWELVEPTEGVFDFALIDGLVKQARAHDLKLVFLWFGSWKNAVSSYVPAWVKTDLKRFPRTQAKDGIQNEVLSPFSPMNREADAHAFAAFMGHLKQIDEKEQTVVMVQVENECGILGDSRDRSALAEEAFRQPVPPELLVYLNEHQDDLAPALRAAREAAGGKTSDGWSDIFGPMADEAFMAWHMARYVGAVAQAGKAAYPIPMYANCWLNGDAKQPAGQYPSGGPIAKVTDIWRAAAPSLDLFAPDIYLSNFKAICAEYARPGNALFIPECTKGPEAIGKAFFAIGQHGTLGFCPFGIDGPETSATLAPGYEQLAELMPLITERQGSDRMAAVLQEEGADRQMTHVGIHNIEAVFRRGEKSNGPSYGLFLELGDDELLVAGSGLTVGFGYRTSGPRVTRIVRIDEGRYRDGKWISGRRLNGDESAGGARMQLPSGPPSLQRITLYRHD